MKQLVIFLTACVLSISTLQAQSRIDKKTFVYAVKNGVQLQLDTYVDNSVAYSGKRPVLLYVHGGGFATGSKINALQIQYGKHFVAQGFISIAINYRLGLKDKDKPDHETILGAVSLASSDLIEATAFILSKADEWNIDSKKIIISGGSAGAIACLNAEYDICSEGPASSRLPKGFNYAGVVSHAGEIVVHQNALTWKKAPCPMLLMHGNKDQQVVFDSLSVSGNL